MTSTKIRRNARIAVSIAALSLAGFTAASLGTTATAASAKSKTSNAESEAVKKLRVRVAELTKNDASITANLKTFDNLDFDVFSNQKWDRLGESHSKDIKVVWPDGHFTVGIDKHIEDLKGLFVHAPDTRIKEHPVGFGSGNMTVVEGVFEGTFTKPMPDGKGGFIAPTGKAFKMPMATIGIWKDGVMIEEHLFWDNQTYVKQIGLA
jgi:SnoaL-like polyketide cyclase